MLTKLWTQTAASRENCSTVRVFFFDLAIRSDTDFFSDNIGFSSEFGPHRYVSLGQKNARLVLQQKKRNRNLFSSTNCCCSSDLLCSRKSIRFRSRRFSSSVSLANRKWSVFCAASLLSNWSRKKTTHSMINRLQNAVHYHVMAASSGCNWEI
jgi:hypothetical protein